jgi:3-deoxy-D-manno-octulosonate 8-phosphate phosphatase (KDO 8-P phosphatase)
MRDLRIRHYLPGRDDKLAAFRELLDTLQLTPEQSCFVGDDVLDLPVLRHVGLAVSVADAHPLVRTAAHLITTTQGGAGAVREITDLLLDCRLGLAHATEEFLATKLGRGPLEKA